MMYKNSQKKAYIYIFFKLNALIKESMIEKILINYIYMKLDLSYDNSLFIS